MGIRGVQGGVRYDRGVVMASNISSHYWSSALKTHTSSSKVSNMNRFKVQPWVPLSALSLPTCLWKSLRSRPLALPHLWLRFVDDTFVIQKAECSQQLLHHINTQDPHKQFTVEEPDQDGSLPFLDTQVSPGPNNTLITTVYRKPTYTVFSTHWYTGPKWYPLTNNHYTRN